MYVIDHGRWNKDSEDWVRATPLLKEIMGYTDEDIMNFIKVQERHYFPPFAININEDQMVPLIQPFIDHKLNVYGQEYDDNTYELISLIPDICKPNEKFVFDRKRESKIHYYDKPILLEHQKVDPFNPPTFNYKWTHLSYGLTSEELASIGKAFTPVKPKPPKPSKPIVTCPYCKSEKTTKISSFEKATNIFFFGIFGQKRKHQWHCNNCKSDF